LKYRKKERPRDKGEKKAEQKENGAETVMWIESIGEETELIKRMLKKMGGDKRGEQREEKGMMGKKK